MRLTKQQIDKITRKIADEGLLVEAGWKGFELGVVPVDASTVQRSEMRLAFFAGSQHLFASILSMLEPGAEETNADLRRMDLIHKELARFEEQFKLRVARPGGSA